MPLAVVLSPLIGAPSIPNYGGLETDVNTPHAARVAGHRIHHKQGPTAAASRGNTREAWCRAATAAPEPSEEHLGLGIGVRKAVPVAAE
eukprot:15159219-Alexandrium_andersonii.AAC.1